MVTPIPTPINAVTASVATWEPARAGTTAFNPFDAPIAAKNALPGPGLYASGNRKTTNPTADSTVMWMRIYGLDTAAETSGTRDDERDTGEHEPDREQRRQRVGEHRGSARAEQHPHDEREHVPYVHSSGRFGRGCKHDRVFLIWLIQLAPRSADGVRGRSRPYRAGARRCRVWPRPAQGSDRPTAR